MIKPEAVDVILRDTFHPDNSEYQRIPDTNGKKYMYCLDFGEYMTFSFLKELTQEASETSEMKLLIDRVTPVVHVERNTTEARVRVIIHEIEDRHELENRSLTEFVS